MMHVSKNEMVSAARKPLAWLLVVTKPFQEKTARTNLLRQAEHFGEGFQVYMPLKLSQNRKNELITSAFFPRYLFARVDLRMESWKRIWHTVGVHGLLGASSGRPLGLADWVVERIHAQEEAGFIRMGLEAEAASAPAFAEGEVVRMAGSPLEAVFLEMVDEKRCRILVSLLGRDSHSTVDLSKLRSTAP